MRSSRLCSCGLALLFATAVSPLPPLRVRAAGSEEVRQLFADPPREYTSAPLWVWNDLLTEDQIRGTLRDLAGQRVHQAFVHPRPGLMTPYLSEDWFRLWKAALDEAAKLDMNLWIYDENSYPSGFAGGFVPELMPESRGLGLEFKEAKSPPAWNDDTIAVHRLDGVRSENVTAQVRSGETLPEGRYLVATRVHAGNSPWHGNRSYVNLLTPGVTEKFLDVTLGAYQREIGDQFGRRVPGMFTDEPNIRPAGGLPWCEDLPQQFAARWHDSLLDHLPSLTREVGDWRRVRYQYYATLNDLFIERWAKPYHDRCAQAGLEFTGHYWDHEWPNCAGVPDNMAMYAWHQRPAIDCLMNQYAENTHAQFGNVRMVRELASIANQLGMKRTLCEIYGAGGWDLRFEDMKRIADWLAVLGVNTFDQHLSYITLRGARKRDHPQSFSYHEPWWDSYHVMATYLTRLSVAMSAGNVVNRLLVIEPTTTAWMYQGDEAKLREIGDSFFKLLLTLEAAQVEYDLGDEDVIARHGAAGPKGLVVGSRGYTGILVPPNTESLNGKTVSLLEQVLAQPGTTVLSLGTPPPRVDGQESDRCAKLAQSASWQNVEASAVPRSLEAWRGSDGVKLTREGGDPGILFHQCRKLDDGELLLLVNTSLESSSAGSLATKFRNLEEWNLFTGQAQSYAFADSDQGASARFRLPPSGSLLLFLTDRPVANGSSPAGQTNSLAATGPMSIRRLEPNVLTLDYADIAAGGETRTNVYFYQANQFAWQKNGMDRDPWDSAVQFKDELISHTFPADSGFTASYHFTIEGAVPENLEMVIERPDLYAVTCNGREVRAKKGAWWLDKAFGRVPLAKTAHTGENVVTLVARPFTMFHELEPAYVLGDFTLKPAARGFVIAPDQPLQLGPGAEPVAAAGTERGPSKPDRIGWNRQGHPFYSAGVGYELRFQVDKSATRYLVSAPGWYGSVARVLVNGDLAGHLAAPPWELDVTRALVKGENRIELQVIGTLKNTLGPHHGNPTLGSAWPGMFQRGPKDGPPPGEQYSTVGYGLFEPFVLRQVLAAK